MAYYNIVIRANTASMTDHTSIKTTVPTEDIEQGEVFLLSKPSADGDETWEMETPTTDLLNDLYMAASSEAPIFTDIGNGVLMTGLTNDKRAFTNKAGLPMDAMLLKQHSIISMTGANIANIATKGYLISQVDSRKLLASTTAGAAGTLTLKKIRTGVYGQSDASTIAPTDTALYTYEVIAN